MHVHEQRREKPHSNLLEKESLNQSERNLMQLCTDQNRIFKSVNCINCFQTMHFKVQTVLYLMLEELSFEHVLSANYKP
jgi:hypothetical protein